jgi:hypothetical protein
MDICEIIVSGALGVYEHGQAGYIARGFCECGLVFFFALSLIECMLVCGTARSAQLLHKYCSENKIRRGVNKYIPLE